MKNSKKFKFFHWLLCFSSVMASIVLLQKSCANKFQYPRVSPGDKPLAKEPAEDSGYEIWSEGKREREPGGSLSILSHTQTMLILLNLLFFSLYPALT